jgi:anhydro-N-acetylmuramic acid kinase
MPYPKSLANDFGTDVVYPIIKDYKLSTEDELCTYVEHIAVQIKTSIALLKEANFASGTQQKLLATGGGALNGFMMQRIQFHLQQIGVALSKTNETMINFKEALVMALIGVLRWREEYNVLATVTGASRNSINGALWLGVEA